MIDLKSVASGKVDLLEERTKQFQEFWKDLGPKMKAKGLSRDKEAEELFLLGWAIGWQEAVQATVDHMNYGMHNGFDDELEEEEEENEL